MCEFVNLCEEFNNSHHEEIAWVVNEYYCCEDVKKKRISVMTPSAMIKRFYIDSCEGKNLFLTRITDGLEHHVPIPT